MTGDNSIAPVGQEKIKDIPPEVHCRIMAIAQDIRFCASNGHIKQAKHICLPMTVRHVTGSKQVVTRLNRFGHGVSASQLEEFETNLAEVRLHEHEEMQHVGLPVSTLGIS